MTRIKKARTPGRIGARKENRETAEQSRERKRKANRKGLAPGSRHNVEGGTQGGKTQKAPQDPRLGSRKPVALVQEDNTREQAVVARARPVPKPQLTPEQELEALENNERLNTLLDRVEDGDKLSKEDKVWLDRTLARHQQLLEQLGLLDEDEEEGDGEPGDDLWERFMDAELDPAQYREEEDKS